MKPRQRYQWVGKTSKEWAGLTRHFRENVQECSRAGVRAQSSQIRKIAGVAKGRADSQRRRVQRFVKQGMAMGPCFRQWTKSVLKSIKAGPITLVVDETKRQDQLGVMLVGIA